MDYKTVDEIINRHGFSSEPAFRNVGVSIHDIGPMDIGARSVCPLGLYYPGSETIVIPPDGHESTLLHELGHRHGHYYYDNLTEQYAEDFRKRYQGGTALMYSGKDLAKLPQLGRLWEEGESGMLDLHADRPVTPGMMNSLYYGLQAGSQGEPVPRLYANGESVHMDFTKGVDWTVILGSIAGGSLLAVLAAMGYSIYKVAKESPWVVPTVVIGSCLLAIAGLSLVGRYGLQKYSIRKV